MLNEEDYKEPRCVLCDTNFYNPDSEEPEGRIEIGRILAKEDSLYDQLKYTEIETLLNYWEKEANSLKDRSGQLTMLSEMIGLFRKMGEKTKAMMAIDKALGLLKTYGFDDSSSAGTIYLNAATTLKAFNELDRAMPCYEKTLELYNKYLKPDDEKYGGLYNNMALAYVDLKEYKKAEDLYNKALKIMKALDGKEPEVAITYVNMAQLYFASLDMDACIDKIMDCMKKAYENLMSDKANKNGYWAFVASSCIPSFEQFGFDSYKQTLKEKVDKIYGRA